MRNWIIGTAFVIGGAIITFCLVVAGFSHTIAGIIGISISVTGFAIQMFTAFSMRASFERENRIAQEQHEEILRRAKTLLPTEAIKLLLRKAK